MTAEAIREVDCEVVCVVGARPNFMKIAPIMAAFAARPIALQHRNDDDQGGRKDQQQAVGPIPILLHNTAEVNTEKVQNTHQKGH